MKLDAGQSPMLAHPAAPLAACVQQNLIAMVTSIDWSKNKFQIDHLQPYSSTNPENLAKIGSGDFENWSNRIR